MIFAPSLPRALKRPDWRVVVDATKAPH